MLSHQKSQKLLCRQDLRAEQTKFAVADDSHAGTFRNLCALENAAGGESGSVNTRTFIRDFIGHAEKVCDW